MREVILVKKKNIKIKSEPAVMSVVAEMPDCILELGNAQRQGARPYQEDSFGFARIAQSVAQEKGVLAVLADGMGGLKNGKAVSEASVSSLIGWFESENTYCNSAIDLKNAASMMNQRICDVYCRGGRIEAGTTLVCVLVKDGYLHWLCIGDSRLYLKRNGRVYQMNEDHDFLNQMLDDVINGDSALIDALTNSQKDSLIGCIGKRDLTSFDYNKRNFKLRDGDILVLCSDGIYNALTPAELNINTTSEAMLSCENIVKLVESKNYPGQDNNTVIIISYKEKGI